MKKFIFDVDGVLTDIGQPIDPEFKTWLLNFFKGHDCGLITGNTRNRTIDKLGYELVEIPEINFFSMGNEICIKYSKPFLVNQFSLKDSEQQWLYEVAQSSPWIDKTGNHFDMRNGSLNFSITGIDASDEQKKAYEQYDLETDERKNIILQFTKTFPRFNAFVGGRASIDICLRGAHKGQIASYLPGDKIVFFGDKCKFNEIDYPLFISVTDPHEITYGYRETWEILKKL